MCTCIDVIYTQKTNHAENTCIAASFITSEWPELCLAVQCDSFKSHNSHTSHKLFLKQHKTCSVHLFHPNRQEHLMHEAFSEFDLSSSLTQHWNARCSISHTDWPILFFSRTGKMGTTCKKMKWHLTRLRASRDWSEKTKDFLDKGS